MKKLRLLWVMVPSLVIFVTAEGASAQQSSTTLQGGVSYTDQTSQTCEEKNANNPFAGMNPFICHGESAPTDSRGGCTLNIGSVWKKSGNTCYYCSPINPPIQGILIPLDQVGNAQLQGWGCGMDQADACMAICTGGKTYSGPPGTSVVGGGPGLPKTPAPIPGGVSIGPAPIPGPAGGIGFVPGPDPCRPSPGYNYCNNGPGARLPAGCVCPGTTIKSSTSSENAPCQPAQPDMPAAAPYVRYTLGFQAGFTGCSVSPTVVGDVAAAAFGSNYTVVPSLLQLNVTPQTMQKVIQPAAAARNSNPYGEGQANGGKLCAWLLANDSGKVSECPGSGPAAQSPLTASASEVCSPMSTIGVMYCAKSQNSQESVCTCNDAVKMSTGIKSCQDLFAQAQKLPKFIPDQALQLREAVSDAQTMLTQAKAHVSKWDYAATYYSFFFFGDSNPTYQKRLSDSIDAELKLLSIINANMEQHIFTDLSKTNKSVAAVTPSWAGAYVFPDATQDNNPIIFIRPGYFGDEAKESRAYRATTIVHELSHLKPAGETEDLAYGVENCTTLTVLGSASRAISDTSNFMKNVGLGQGGASLSFSLTRPRYMDNPRGWEFESIIPTVPNAALMNADSFALFVSMSAGYPVFPF